MSQDDARTAAVANALTRIEPGMTIGLGSGRAVFALATAIGEKWPNRPPVAAVAASPHTEQLARAAGVEIADLDATTVVDIAFDGADEIDPYFQMIKGGGAALLTEKLVLAAASHTVIMVEDVKLVDRLGTTRRLPVEVVRFGWQTTRARLLDLVDSAELRLDEGGQPVVTSQGHFLVDVVVPAIPLEPFADKLKLTLGAIEHGLFLRHCDELIVGRSDGSIDIQSRPTRRSPFDGGNV